MKTYDIKANDLYNNKVEAIKALRECTGLNLIDSKNAVEAALGASGAKIHVQDDITFTDLGYLRRSGLNVTEVLPPVEHYVASTLKKLTKRVLDDNGSPVVAEKLLNVLNELNALGLLK